MTYVSVELFAFKWVWILASLQLGVFLGHRVCWTDLVTI